MIHHGGTFPESPRRGALQLLREGSKPEAETRSGSVHESPVRDRRTRPTPTKYGAPPLLPHGTLPSRRSDCLKRWRALMAPLPANLHMRFQVKHERRLKFCAFVNTNRPRPAPPDIRGPACATGRLAATSNSLAKRVLSVELRKCVRPSGRARKLHFALRPIRLKRMGDQNAQAEYDKKRCDHFKKHGSARALKCEL